MALFFERTRSKRFGGAAPTPGVRRKKHADCAEGAKPPERQLSLLEPAEPPPKPVPPVPGLAYVPNYVSVAEERALLEAIDAEPWLLDRQRRRQIYGLSYGSARANATMRGSLPDWIGPLAERVVRNGWLDAPVAKSS